MSDGGFKGRVSLDQEKVSQMVGWVLNGSEHKRQEYANECLPWLDSAKKVVTDKDIQRYVELMGHGVKLYPGILVENAGNVLQVHDNFADLLRHGGEHYLKSKNYALYKHFANVAYDVSSLLRKRPRNIPEMV